MYKLTYNPHIPPLRTRACDLEIGDIAEIIAPRVMYIGDLILRTFDGFINLNHPHATWEKDCYLDVRKLLPGEVINIVIQRN